MALLPRLAERMHAAKQEERFQGTADLPNFFRKPYGPGWALVGDAGYHKDPLPALGISDAFRDAELLSEAIDEGMSGRCSIEVALAEYERRRNAIAMPLYENACRGARLESTPLETTRLVAALQGNQVDTDRFVGAFVGTVAREEFFAPENVQRILGGVDRSAVYAE
jgi:flavin-dependent dehydrogenase